MRANYTFNYDQSQKRISGMWVMDGKHFSLYMQFSIKFIVFCKFYFRESQEKSKPKRHTIKQAIDAVRITRVTEMKKEIIRSTEKLPPFPIMLRS